jgi:hypothetical protein
MRVFLWLASLVLLGILIGVIKAHGMGMPITIETFPWGSVAIILLLVSAWWLTRKKPADEDEPVEKSE